MSLWDDCVAVHGRPGVEEACLDLQDQYGQCVSLLLWRLWAVAETRPVSAETMRQACACARAWDGAAISPLRAARRAIKGPLAPIADTSRVALRTRIAILELEAERLLIDALEGLSAPRSGFRDEALEALAAVSAAWNGSAPRDALARLITAAR